MLATSVTFCSEGLRWGDHWRLQNGAASARLASWRSGAAVRADPEVGGHLRRPDDLKVTRRDGGGREEVWRQWRGPSYVDPASQGLGNALDEV